MIQFVNVCHSRAKWTKIVMQRLKITIKISQQRGTISSPQYKKSRVHLFYCMIAIFKYLCREDTKKWITKLLWGQKCDFLLFYLGWLLFLHHSFLLHVYFKILPILSNTCMKLQTHTHCHIHTGSWYPNHCEYLRQVQKNLLRTQAILPMIQALRGNQDSLTASHEDQTQKGKVKLQ